MLHSFRGNGFTVHVCLVWDSWLVKSIELLTIFMYIAASQCSRWKSWCDCTIITPGVAHVLRSLSWWVLLMAINKVCTLLKSLPTAAGGLQMASTMAAFLTICPGTPLPPVSLSLVGKYALSAARLLTKLISLWRQAIQMAIILSVTKDLLMNYPAHETDLQRSQLYLMDTQAPDLKEYKFWARAIKIIFMSCIKDLQVGRDHIW